MKLSERSIAALAKVVTGDSGVSLYRSGPKLVKLSMIWEVIPYTGRDSHPDGYLQNLRFAG